MQQLFTNIINAVWGIWRFRWTALIVAWLVAVLGWAVVGTLDYKYSSRARIFVDTNRVLEPLLKGITVRSNVTQRVSLISRALLTRPNIELLAVKAGLDTGIQSSEELEVLYENIERNIQLFPVGREQSIYAIEFEHTDPVVAKSVVEILISIFIESNLSDEQDDNEQTEKFLDDRIGEYETRLRDSEQRLTIFKRENNGSMPSEAGGFYQRLQLTQINLRTAKSALREATNRRDELSRQLEKENPLVFSSSSSGTGLRIAELQSELDLVLQRYTALHPRAQQLRDSIDELEIVQIEEAKQPGTATRLQQDNVVYQNLRPIVAESQAAVAELKSRVIDLGEQVVELESTVDSIPKVEAELKQLNRDYETVKDQHDRLLERREAARLSMLERGDDESKFKIIEPPILPVHHSSPNKPLLHIGVFAIALGAGFALAIVLSVFKPVYFEQRTLQAQTGFPVFGSVTMHRSKAVLYKRYTANLLYCAAVCLLFVFLVVIVIVSLSGNAVPVA